MRIHSSGILFSRAIRNGLKNGTVTVVISPDSATKETYKIVKRVDKSDKVWANIKHYRRKLPEDLQKLVKVKFIIIPGINDTFKEILEFLRKIKEIDIKSVIIDIEYTYANSNSGNISPHVYLLMDYIENYCNSNNIEYDLYDSAKYAIANRKFEKTSNFNDEFFKQLLQKYKAENLKNNISYQCE